MSRGGPVDPQQQKIQRIMLYGSPLLLAIFGLRFPIAVLVYWLVTNTWSMAQQVFILRKMPPVLPGHVSKHRDLGASHGRRNQGQAEPSQGGRSGAACTCAAARSSDGRIRRPSNRPRTVPRPPMTPPPNRRRQATRLRRTRTASSDAGKGAVPVRHGPGALSAAVARASAPAVTTARRRSPRAKDHERADGDEQHRPGFRARLDRGGLARYRSHHVPNRARLPTSFRRATSLPTTSSRCWTSSISTVIWTWTSRVSGLSWPSSARAWDR